MNENIGLGAQGVAAADQMSTVRRLLALSDETSDTIASPGLSLAQLWHVEAAKDHSGDQSTKTQCIVQAYRLLVQVRAKSF